MKDVLSPTVDSPAAPTTVIAPPRNRCNIFFLLAAAFVVRAVVLFLGIDQGLFYPDEFEYAELARNLAIDNEFSYKGHLTSFRPPLFPFIASVTYRLFGDSSPVPVRAVQMLFSLATIWVIYRLGRDGWGERIGLLAAGIFAFYPSLIGYNNMLLTEPGCIFFVSLACWAMLRHLLHPGLGWGVAAGVALGFGALIRDTLFYAGPLATLFLAGHAWRNRRFRLLHIAAFAGGFILAILPWSMRNTLLHGQPTLISSVGGITFYLCNNEKAPLIRSSSLFYEKQIGEEYYYETLMPELNGLNETEKNDVVTRMALEYMLANPGATFLRMLARFVDFWGQERLVINHVLSRFYGEVPFMGTLLVIAAVFGVYSLVVIGAGFGYFFAKLRAFDIFGLLFIAYYTVMHLLVFAHPRYHMPLLPFLALMAARAFALRAEIKIDWRNWRFLAATGAAMIFVSSWIVGLFFFDTKYIELLMQYLS
jgi:4-amino-4-deoxy-L-arabinose transferase-like glycosyltransferase